MVIQLIPLKNSPFRAFSIREGASIGRNHQNTIVLRNLAVTQFHARINGSNQEWWVTDLNSRNGTFVNGVRIDRQRLEHGDQVAFGSILDCQFRVIIRYEANQIEPSEPGLSHQNLAIFGLCSTLLIGGSYAGYHLATNKSQPTITITNPASGMLIQYPTQVTVETADPDSIAQVIFLVDSIEITRSPEPPFTAYLDPSVIQQQVDTKRGTHVLSATAQLTDGTMVNCLNPTPIQLEQLPTNQPSIPNQPEGIAPQIIPQHSSHWFSPSELEEPPNEPYSTSTRTSVPTLYLPDQLLHQLGSPSYSLGNSWLQSIETALQGKENFSFHLSPEDRKKIMETCARRGVRPEIVLILAESQTDDQGVWKIPEVIWNEYNLHNTKDPDEQLHQIVQYLKDLLTCFDEQDWPYAIACYGTNVQSAGKIRQKLERYDPQKTIRSNLTQTFQTDIFPSAGIGHLKKFMVTGIQIEFPQVNIDRPSFSNQTIPQAQAKPAISNLH